MSGVVIRARGVRYAREGRTVLDGVSLDVLSGSTAIVGPSGSGKSTLLALLGGLEAPDAGTIESSAASVALVLQGHGLVSLLTAEENVGLPLQAGARPPTARQVRARTAQALAAVHLTDVADHLVEALSGGQQQRVAVARALVTDAALLIADEATASLDAENRDLIADLLFARATGGSLLIATHDERVAARADRVLRLEAGRLVAVAAG